MTTVLSLVCLRCSVQVAMAEKRDDFPEDAVCPKCGRADDLAICTARYGSLEQKLPIIVTEDVQALAEAMDSRGYCNVYEELDRIFEQPVKVVVHPAIDAYLRAVAPDYADD